MPEAPFKFDRLDLRILAQLQKNGRMTNVDLADAVGYRPRVAVEEGVRNFVDWYRSYNGVL